jgi:hypothetical protein
MEIKCKECSFLTGKIENHTLYCKKLKHELENWYAALFHSKICGE